MSKEYCVQMWSNSDRNFLKSTYYSVKIYWKIHIMANLQVYIQLYFKIFVSTYLL